MQTMEFVVTGEQKMHCSACEARVAYTLRQLDGVREVRASAKNQHVLVVSDRVGAVDTKQVSEKLREIGYEVQPVASPA